MQSRGEYRAVSLDETTYGSKNRLARISNFKCLYLVAIVLAFLFYGALDINIHTSESVIASVPSIVFELNIKRSKPIDLILSELSSSPEYQYAEGSFDEEGIVSDPLTDFILDSNDTSEFSAEAEDGIDDEEGELTALELKRIEVNRMIALYRGPIRVALYVGPGTTTNAKNNIPKVLTDCSEGNILVDAFGDASLSTVGRLKHDVLFIPGGSAGRIYTEMMSKSKKQHRLMPQMKIRKFLEKGGGYIGICAGAYLAAGGKSGKSPFRISMFKTESGMLGDGYFSGTALDPHFAFTATYQEQAGGMINSELKDSQLFYANGPIFKNETFENPEFPQMQNPEVVLRMGNEAFLRILYGKKTGKSTHKRHQGLPLIVMNSFGKGKVVLSTAHPETSVHEVSYDTWQQARDPSKCDSPEAKELISMVYLAAQRGPSNIVLS